MEIYGVTRSQCVNHHVRSLIPVVNELYFVATYAPTSFYTTDILLRVIFSTNSCTLWACKNHEGPHFLSTSYNQDIQRSCLKFHPLSDTPKIMEDLRRFHWSDYLVFVVMMTMSLGTGVYFGIVKKQKRTAEEFLMAGRNMNVVPVSFSVVVRSVHCLAEATHSQTVYELIVDVAQKIFCCN